MNGIHQGRLEYVLRSLFPNEKIITNVRKDANILSSANAFLELDIWFPELKLAFEFQDVHHYKSTWSSHVSLHKIQAKDKHKNSQLADRGETLIVIPYWWDGKEESLAATIHAYRRDLIPDSMVASKPIPAESPVELESEYVPGVGELLKPSFVSSPFFDPTSWWLDEKYDGVRACWNPHTKVLYSQSGKKLKVFKRWLSYFPKAFLDGEIWLGRGSFIESLKVYEGESDMVQWPAARFIVFDSPLQSSPDLTESGGDAQVLHGACESKLYEHRYELVLANVAVDHPFAIPSSPMICKSKHHLVTITHAILEHSGEGTIIHKPRSLYDHGRSVSVLKFKAAREDMEALVVGVGPDSISLKLPDGVIFTSTLHERIAGIQLQVGDVVTFAFESFIQDRPRKTQIIKLRKDISWDRVLSHFHHRVSLQHKETSITKRAFTPVQYRQPKGYWTQDGGHNTRLFFDNFAKSHRFQPSDASAWYRFPADVFYQLPGGVTVLQHYGGSLIKALTDVYPHLQLDPSKFKFKSQNFWQDKANRRKFLDNFAHKSGFDPLVPEHWYSTTPFDICAEKGGISFLNLYSSSIVTALQDVYPDIRFDVTQFAPAARKYASIRLPKAGLKFFNQLAQKMGFDPLVPENWYMVPKSVIVSEKGARAVLAHYQHSHTAALVSFYPNIGLQRIQFTKFKETAQYAANILGRYASERNFDPLVARNWYRVAPGDLIGDQRVVSLLSQYGSRYRAISRAYPDIGLQKTEFKTKTFG